MLLKLLIKETDKTLCIHPFKLLQWKPLHFVQILDLSAIC